MHRNILPHSPLSWIFDSLNKKESPYYTVVVVSPLVALMKDQVKALTDKGAQAVYVQDKFDNEDDIVKLILLY